MALAYPSPPHHPERPRWYPTEDGLNFQKIDAPTPISQIPKMEKLNNLVINVFGWDKGVNIYRLSTQPEGMPRINLLLIEKAGKFHYTWIKDLNHLLRDQSKHKECKHFCERCLHGYTREDLLEARRPECRGIARQPCRWRCRKRVRTSSHFRTTTGSCRPPTSSLQTLRLSPPGLRGNTQRTQHHEACSYSYIVVRCDGQTEPPVEYRDPNAAEHFLESLQEVESKINCVLADPKAMRMTQEDWLAFRIAETCHVCDKPLESDSA